MTVDNDELTPVSLRLPRALTEKLKSIAKDNRRSMNAETTLILERALKPGTKAGTEAATSIPAK